jgi:hypothetical protein
MKRFAFPLERVRKWREGQAELEETRLQQLYAELRAYEAAQQRLSSETEASCRALMIQTTITAEELSTLEDYRLYAARESRRLEARKRETEARIRQQRQQVLEAHRRFKLLEGLRDKALVTWSAARDKEQEDLAAELFLTKRNRDQ